MDASSSMPFNHKQGQSNGAEGFDETGNVVLYCLTESVAKAKGVGQGRRR